MISVKDDLGYCLTLHATPQRIVSLVPSQSELLHYLGLSEKVVGITNFCSHPPHWRKNKEIVGGTKTLDIKLIASLNPDLIIGNKEENVKSQIEKLQGIAPTYVSDVNNVDEALHMIKSIGLLTGTIKNASVLIDLLKQGFDQIKCEQPKTCIYVIWNQPIMVVGTNTFIDTMLNYAGFENALKSSSRYPELSEAKIKSLNPEYILLSSEPYPFKEKNKGIFEKEFPNAKVLLVDGRKFSWYGSAMLSSLQYFRELRKI